MTCSYWQYNYRRLAVAIIVGTLVSPAWAGISWTNDGTGTAAFETASNWDAGLPGETTPPGVYTAPGGATARTSAREVHSS